METLDLRLPVKMKIQRLARARSHRAARQELRRVLHEAAASPRYNKKRKKLPEAIKRAVTAEEDRILANPRKGDQ